MEDPFATIVSHLGGLGVEYEVVDHPPAHTMQDLSQLANDKNVVPIKNLFLYDHKNNHYLETLVNIKQVEKQLQTKGCRFASLESLLKLLGVTQGAATPLCAAFDTKNLVTFVFDSSLREVAKKVSVHPMVNTKSVFMSVDDLIRAVEATSHAIQWLSFEGAQPTSKNPSQEPAAKVSPDTLAITAKKATEFSEWYVQTIVRSTMIEYYDVSGCYILRPLAYFIWEKIQDFMNDDLRQINVQNCYFPLFVTKNRLETEKDHIEGFSPEVAWVTRYGKTDLPEPIAIRPTSETIIYPAYSKWIRSYRDLPMKYNQVVRWEFKQPTPFIRTREFLWQEGHTAHETHEEAHDLMLRILDLYKRVYEDMLAVPVVPGLKSENEKFAGGLKTSTIEAFISENGRAIQAGTSHHLGTNFSKMFKIEYEDRSMQKQLVHQTSWGLSSRAIGIAIMIHGDDKGLVLPPRVAATQVVFIPIPPSKGAELKDQLEKKCSEFISQLKANKIRCTLDDRTNYSPGWKFNEWEQKGVCLRVELGASELKNETCRVVRRHDGKKLDIPWSTFVDAIPTFLTEMHKEMFSAAKKKLDEGIAKVTQWKDVLPTVNQKKLILVPWCEKFDTEEQIKAATRIEGAPDDDVTTLTGPVKSICRPFDQPELTPDTKCFFTGEPAKGWWLFGRSY